MNRITEFVDSFIPKNLPKARKKQLTDELTNHILDKTDFYKEIGFPEDKSIEKAIDDFGRDEDMKKHVFSEFEELYSERAIWGILSFIGILLMNLMCFYLDLWVVSADWNRDPDPISAFCGFMAILFVLLLLVTARIKKYRKMLIFTGVSNLLISLSVLLCLYPQMAAYTLEYDLIYLIDRFTPIPLGDVIIGASNGIVSAAVTFGFPLAISLYSFVAAYKIKRGSAKKIKRPVRKTVIFCAVYIALSLFFSAIVNTADNYIEDYPLWLDYYHCYISDEAREIYEGVNIGDKTEEVSDYLHSVGFKTTEEFRKDASWHTRKQFDNNLKHFDFAEDYTIWFSPDEYIPGNGIIGVKEENGIVTGVAVGNLNREMSYDEPTYKNNYGVGIYNTENENTDEVISYFKDLKKGDSIIDVMAKLGNEYGVIYSERISTENGTPKHYYRIYCRNESDEFRTLEYEYLYMELTFSDMKFERGTLYWEEHHSDGTETNMKYVR